MLPRRLRKVEVSADQRPPTSPARPLLLGPTNSRHVRSFHRRAASRAIQSTLATRAGRVVKVVSTASCAPPNNGRPSAIISLRRPSCTSVAKNIQITHMHVGRKAPPSIKFARQCSQLQTPVCPEPLLCCTLRNGGQMNRVDGHTGRCERQRAKANGGGATKAHGTNGGQSWLHHGTVWLSMLHPPMDHFWIATRPVHSRSTGSEGTHDVGAQPWKTPHAATLVSRNQDHTPQCHGEVANTFRQCGPRWVFEPFHPHQTLPCITCRCQRHTLCLLPTQQLILATTGGARIME